MGWWWVPSSDVQLLKRVSVRRELIQCTRSNSGAHRQMCRCWTRHELTNWPLLTSSRVRAHLVPLGPCCAPVASWTPPPLVQCSLNIRHVSMCPTRASSATRVLPSSGCPLLGWRARRFPRSSWPTPLPYLPFGATCRSSWRENLSGGSDLLVG